MKGIADKAQDEGRPATEEKNLWEKMKESDELLVGGLIRLYNLQEMDEQQSHQTKYQNLVGFNAVDAEFLTSLAKFYLDRGFLTPKQLDNIKKLIPKYCNQLERVGGVVPMPIKGKKEGEKKEPFKELKWAGMTGGGKEIAVKFQFPKGDRRFQDTLEIIKRLPGRRWNPDDKTWTLPLLVPTFETLVNEGFEIAPKLKEWYDSLISPSTDVDFDIPGFETHLGKGIKGLWPFQRKGVAFLQDRGGRALIGDDMGLGKTAQTLAWLQLNKERALPALAIVPANVKLHWKRCCENWTEIPTVLLSGRNGNGTTNISAKRGGDQTLTIINYDVLDSWLPTLERSGFKTIILDEAHYIKNNSALRTKATKKLARKVKFFIPLSGTPIESRPLEFWNCLDLLRKDLFTYYDYRNRYCDPVYNPFATQAMQKKEEAKARRERREPKKVKPIFDYKGASNTEELHRILTSTIMIRRMKREVLPDLPEKIRSVIPIELSNWDEYEMAESKFVDDLDETYVFGEAPKKSRDSAEALRRIEMLKQISARGKMEGVTSWIEDYLESAGEMKLVVFAWHQEIVDQLVQHFRKLVGVVKIDGRDSSKQRQEAEDSFNDDPKTRLFVGNIKAAGVGISLRGAADTCFVEIGWNPGQHDQAEDRVIGINRGVEGITSSNAYYLLAADTIEEEIASLLDQKREVVDMILDGKEVESSDLFLELLKRMKKKKEKSRDV